MIKIRGLAGRYGPAAPRRGARGTRAPRRVAAAAVAVAILAAGAVPTVATAAAGSGLDADVAAVRATGMVGVLAQEQDGHDQKSARAGTTRLGGDRPVPYDAEFRFGSITKTFVATTLLQLVGEGRLSLDDTLDRLLPGLIHGNGNDGRKITVREILQHTSGIYDYLYDPSVGDVVGTAAGYRRLRFRSYRPEQLVAVAMGHKPLFAPGTSWSYSNTNYIIAGMIIQRVTGRPWMEEVNRRIVEPLHLRHTYLPGNDPYLQGPHPDGYDRFPDAAGLTDTTALNATVAGAAGALVSTTADLNTFWRALTQGRLLKPAQQREMQTTVPVPPDAGEGNGVAYGLGVSLFPLSCGGDYWGHTGGASGFQSVAGALPNGAGSVVVAMTGPGTEAMGNAALELIDHALCAAK